MNNNYGLAFLDWLQEVAFLPIRYKVQETQILHPHLIKQAAAHLNHIFFGHC